MKTASSTTSTRAMSGGSFLGCVGSGEDVFESHGPLVLLEGDEPAGRDARAVDEDVDGVVGRAVELDDRAVGQTGGVGRAQARAAELGPDAQRDLAQRLAQLVGALGVELGGR